MNASVNNKGGWVWRLCKGRRVQKMALPLVGLSHSGLYGSEDPLARGDDISTWNGWWVYHYERGDLGGDRPARPSANDAALRREIATDIAEKDAKLDEYKERIADLVLSHVNLKKSLEESQQAENAALRNVAILDEKRRDAEQQLVVVEAELQRVSSSSSSASLPTATDTAENDAKLEEYKKRIADLKKSLEESQQAENAALRNVEIVDKKRRDAEQQLVVVEDELQRVSLSSSSASLPTAQQLEALQRENEKLQRDLEMLRQSSEVSRAAAEAARDLENKVNELQARIDAGERGAGPVRQLVVSDQIRNLTKEEAQEQLQIALTELNEFKGVFDDSERREKLDAFRRVALEYYRKQAAGSAVPAALSDDFSKSVRELVQNDMNLLTQAWGLIAYTPVDQRSAQEQSGAVLLREDRWMDPALTDEQKTQLRTILSVLGDELSDLFASNVNSDGVAKFAEGKMGYIAEQNIFEGPKQRELAHEKAEEAKRKAAAQRQKEAREQAKKDAARREFDRVNRETYSNWTETWRMLLTGDFDTNAVAEAEKKRMQNDKFLQLLGSDPSSVIDLFESPATFQSYFPTKGPLRAAVSNSAKEEELRGLMYLFSKVKGTFQYKPIDAFVVGQKLIVNDVPQGQPIGGILQKLEQRDPEFKPKSYSDEFKAVVGYDLNAPNWGLVVRSSGAGSSAAAAAPQQAEPQQPAEEPPRPASQRQGGALQGLRMLTPEQRAAEKARKEAETKAATEVALGKFEQGAALDDSERRLLTALFTSDAEEGNMDSKRRTFLVDLLENNADVFKGKSRLKTQAQDAVAKNVPKPESQPRQAGALSMMRPLTDEEKAAERAEKARKKAETEAALDKFEQGLTLEDNDYKLLTVLFTSPQEKGNVTDERKRFLVDVLENRSGLISNLSKTRAQKITTEASASDAGLHCVVPSSSHSKGMLSSQERMMFNNAWFAGVQRAVCVRKR